MILLVTTFGNSDADLFCLIPLTIKSYLLKKNISYGNYFLFIVGSRFCYLCVRIECLKVRFVFVVFFFLIHGLHRHNSFFAINSCSLPCYFSHRYLGIIAWAAVYAQKTKLKIIMFILIMMCCQTNLKSFAVVEEMSVSLVLLPNKSSVCHIP